MLLITLTFLSRQESLANRAHLETQSELAQEREAAEGLLSAVQIFKKRRIVQRDSEP